MRPHFNVDDLLTVKPGGVIRCYGDPRIAAAEIQHMNNCLADAIRYSHGDCKHCGGPLSKAKNSLCHYCQKPIWSTK